MLALFKGDEAKFKNRWSFEVGINASKPFSSGYVIVDESDDIMFRDLVAFKKAT